MFNIFSRLKLRRSRDDITSPPEYSAMDPVSSPSSNTTLFSNQQSLSRFFNSPLFSDLTIRFSGKEIHAHKIIICSQSAWFAAAFEGKFSEAPKYTLELKDDDPISIEAMFRFFYNLPPTPQALSHTSSPPTNLLLLSLVKIYITADKYDVPLLRTSMITSFTHTASSSCLQLWNEGSLPEIIKTIYSNTVARNDAMRKTIVETCVENFEMMRRDTPDALRRLLEETPDFSADILMAMPPSSSPWTPPSPSKIVEQEVEVYVPSPIPSIHVNRSLNRPNTKTELHTAAEHGKLGRCRTLLNGGVPVDILDQEGETPLHFAAWFGRAEVVKLLVERGADVDKRKLPVRALKPSLA
ncbi:hypothetical protein G7Y89_g12047 [Cudoniella acicularis]|uniref:BTB domain-containing protein n=1 Tax=Cudoniella acicularis TaxID=354080 RepID=A0A8H4VZK0_9HELO|nr:hypothetical protein G7Y89_g12047 [Cudoniella acicularis]